MDTIRACTLNPGNIVFIAAYLGEPEKKIEDLLQITTDFGDIAVIIETRSDSEKTWTFTSSRAFTRDYIPAEIMHLYNFVEVMRR